MDEDSWSLPDSDYEKDPFKEDVVDYDDDSADDSSETTQQSCPMMTQSSFLVPKIDLGAQNNSPSCKDTLAAPVSYGLMHAQGIPSQNSQELFVLDKKLTTKDTLNPMAKEFKPSFGGNFLQNRFASIASKPEEMSVQSVQHSAPLSADDKLLLNIKQILKISKLLILMRGCPGSGKTTLADKIMKSLDKSDKSSVVLSTDNFFYSSGNQYQYDVSKLSEAHAWNKSKALEAIHEKYDLIIIDNTNIAKWEMAPYAKMANENGYKVKLVEPSTQWKFDAKRLAKCNVHSVSLHKIKQMLGNYERKLTVTQLLNFKDSKESKSSLEYEWNNSKTPVEVQPQRNESGRDKNNNSNTSPHSLYSPELVLTPRIIVKNDIHNIDKIFSKLAKSFEACSSKDSWGSDDWYEPQNQRQPKKNAISSNTKSNSSDDGSNSSDAFDAQVNEVQQILNKEFKVKSLSSLALTCIDGFNAVEIFEMASLSVVKGCQMKDKILHECFARNNASKFLLQNLTDSSNEESSACSIDSQTESLRSSTSEDSIDNSSEENDNFYLTLSLPSQFLGLLTTIEGPIRNLNMQEDEPGETVEIKLDRDAVRSFHKTLTQICAPKKKTKAVQQVGSSAPTTFSRKMSPVVPLSEIMKEQETSAIELQHKLKNNDPATAQKLHRLCLEFPGTDPSIIAKMFEENDYHLHRTFAVLKGQQPEGSIDWRCASNSPPTPSRNKNTYSKTRTKTYDWLKVSKDNEQGKYELYEKLLKANIEQKNLYSNGSYPLAASYFANRVSDLRQQMKGSNLNVVKQRAALKLNQTNYNKIDLHGLNKQEAYFLVNECLNDYSEALKTSTSMKKNLIFITGKGMNSKNKKPVLKPYVISILKKLNYTCTEDGGIVKVLL